MISTIGHEDIGNTDVFWAYEGIIKDRVDKFDPSKPKDGIPGYLAYNHGDKRMKTRTGRFLTKKLKLNEKLPEAIIRDISEKINEELFGEIAIRLDSGSKITDNYRHAVGNSSCMTNSEADCTKLYENNPDRFQQLVMNFVSDSARAIVAKLDNGQYYLDRVYSSSSNLKERMRKYAAGCGWLWRDNDEDTIYLGENKDKITDYGIIKVTGLTYKNGEVPYMDTFHKYKLVKGRLDIYHHFATNDYDGRLDSTDGYIGEEGMCSWCGGDFSEDCLTTLMVNSSVGDESFCDECLENNFFRCMECRNYQVYDEGTEITTHIHLRGTRIVCDSCLSGGGYSDCRECGDWFNNDEILTVDGGEYCSECAEQHFTLCEDCDDWVSESHVVDGKFVCEDCLDSYCKCEDCGEHLTIYQVIEKEGGYKCIDCAGLGDIKGQSKFEFDKPITVRSAMERYREIVASSSYRVHNQYTVRPVNLNMSEASA